MKETPWSPLALPPLVDRTRSRQGVTRKTAFARSRPILPPRSWTSDLRNWENDISVSEPSSLWSFVLLAPADQDPAALSRETAPSTAGVGGEDPVWARSVERGCGSGEACGFVAVGRRKLKGKRDG